MLSTELTNDTHHIQARSRVRSSVRFGVGLKGAVLSGALLVVGALGGCGNAGEGLFTGAALGSVTGLVLGSMNGQAGEGAAIGAVLGGAGGAILGDQNERNRYNAQYGSYEYDSRPRHRDGYQRSYRAPRPFRSTHRVYREHSYEFGSHPISNRHGSNRHGGGYGYGHSEWWNH